MPAPPPFVSFARNAEDVVLYRALANVNEGRYVEVGADHPSEPSATRAFYDRGWSGIVVVPAPESAETFRRERPRDTVVPAGVTDAVLEEHLRPGDTIHFLVADTAGSARAVLAGVDLRRWRPWVLVVRTTEPDPSRQPDQAWEEQVREAGYEVCLFDGVSRFYVATEQVDRLRPALSSPANVLDGFVPHRCDELERELDRLREAHEGALDELVRWRGEALSRWSDAIGPSGTSSAHGSHEVVRLRAELAAMQATVSWRVTAPLRALQRQRRAWR